MSDPLSDEMKMAAQMGMRAGVEMAIAGLVEVQANPRSQRVESIHLTLQAAIDALRTMASRQWPEGRA